ncbi:MAG TPA: pyruvate, phosphate dikinase [Stellaceae bacterium]|nr:pyruvate, phosphate dikinase [Stellaceae bacterium]
MATKGAKWVYSFGGGAAEGRADMRNLLGGKGANLAEMSSLGLPVPPGFTITTEVCTQFYANQRNYPSELQDQVGAALAAIEQAIGARLGDPRNPLLVSVRSGARASMPGMMDTVLNLGLNDRTVEGLVDISGDERFAWDSYRRFLQMYGEVVLGIEHHHFESVIDDYKIDAGVTLDTELKAQDWQAVAAGFKDIVRNETGEAFPQDVQAQLWGAIGAVFSSWMSSRAITYRRLNNIPENWGTAVSVQAMVFGNRGDDCATGVAFTRNPSTGSNEFYGEFLVNAQGEDVVAGIRTPQSLTIAGKEANGSSLPSMEEVMPAVFADLLQVRDRLEDRYRDMQDIEFTVERGRLWMLQTRTGKRTAQAALKIAVNLVEEGVIDQAEAIRRIEPNSLDQLLHPMLDPAAKINVLTRGLPASPGAAAGKVVFSAEEAESCASRGEAVILARLETSPEDIHGMHAARGILTARGGMTSHAAVVARGMGRPCVAGASDVRIDYAARTLTVRNVLVREGDLLTLNGSTGEVILGEVPTIEPTLSGDFATLMAWADELRTLRIRTNAETPTDARTARNFGAEGIGLSRTEHMFFEADRIGAIRQMIMADEEPGRRAALAKLLPMQRADFEELFKIMAGLPVTIRLLDPPLHEFLPKTEPEFDEMARLTGKSTAEVRQRANALHETNPMLGHRGCRLGITFPEIYEMQAVAIFEAACAAVKETSEPVEPEIMVPLIATKREFDILKDMVDRVGAEIMEREGVTLPYSVGTMIELPRAALMAGEIAETAQFFSFGTNDLTQTVYGLSRDDAASFIGSYQKMGIFEHDPFVTLDTEGVGQLIRIAVDRGRATRPDLKLGICGEHGGDPASIRFCRDVGLDYVSCSPYRVPIARLAAAQAELNGDLASTA